LTICQSITIGRLKQCKAQINIMKQNDYLVGMYNMNIFHLVETIWTINVHIFGKLWWYKKEFWLILNAWLSSHIWYFDNNSPSLELFLFCILKIWELTILLDVEGIFKFSYVFILGNWTRKVKVKQYNIDLNHSKARFVWSQ
jgi:hypothetical protein